MKRIAHILLLLLMLGGVARGQGDPLVEALRNYQSGALNEAKVLVDEAVASPQHAQNAEAWLLRGFIYKDAYKAATAAQQGDPLREEALKSLYRCITLDTAGTYKENATQAYDFLTRSYFNDAAKALNEMNEVRAMEVFPKFKEAALLVDPKADLRLREIEFTNALGTVFTKRFNTDRTDTTLFARAVEAYTKVLELDPENYGANYNLATLYYNRGVYNIQRIDAEDEIPTILEVQQASREYFQKALPYMLKAHDMNPSRRETLLGLEGIYYSLQDQESSDKFRQLFEEMPPEEDR
ncbi:MAG: tetratricopeptide repeat protein [Flavobacteriales bacterium]|nr:tetratricopeptide repeat protein [Flavobacteriales bacterium]